MIRIFTGENRIRANQAVSQILGENYEIIEGTDLTPNDLPSIFQGASLFSVKRNILIRDLSDNKPTFEKIPEYLDTPHDVIILELKLDKRSATYKMLKDQIEIRDFPLPKDPNINLVFDIYRTAKVNGKKAVKDLDKIKHHEDPIRFCGLMISQALKDYRAHQGTKEKRALKELSKLDLDLKTTSLEPWLLIQSFLLRVSSL